MKSLFGLLIAGLMLFNTIAGRAEDVDSLMRRQLMGHWKESGAGRAIIWWDFDPDLVIKTEEDGGTFQETRYEGFRLKTDVNPARLDLFYKENNGPLRAKLGIVQFVRDRMIWVEGKDVDAKAWARARGNLAGRPLSFTPPKGSPYTRRILVRPGPQVYP